MELKKTKKLLEQYKMAVDVSTIVSKTDSRGVITYVNDEFCNISKFEKDELIGKSHSIIRHSDNPKSLFKDMWKIIKSGKIWKGLIKNRAKDGSTYYVDSVIVPILDINNQIIEYMSIRKLIENNRILDKARRDDLTILKSRAYLLEDLDDQDSTKESLILALIDIKSFKYINDFYGHKIGDLLLQKIAIELQLFFNNDNYNLYRIPIDTFAILSFNNDKDKFIKQITSFINLLSSKPIYVENYKIYLDSRVGISKTSSNKILQHTNMALDYSKNSNTKIVIYENQQNLKESIEKNIFWTNLVNEAINEDRILTYYQPIVNNKTLEFEKYEALSRLIDEENNIISPNIFINISKQIKLYSKITKNVISNSIKDLQISKCEFSINLSMNDFEDEITMSILEKAILDSKIANRLVIEITESEEIVNFDSVKNTISKLKKYGCKIAIDDFGSGYSNFNYITEIEADYIKIDGSLIKDLDKNESSQAIVRAIVGFAKELKIKTIAEYVSNESIFNKVRNMGIDYSQGFYFSKPKPNIEL